jgi:hypothetical protein
MRNRGTVRPNEGQRQCETVAYLHVFYKQGFLKVEFEATKTEIKKDKVDQ